MNSDLKTKPEKELPKLCEQYDTILQTILNKHAPLLTKTVSERPPTPWMTQEILKAKVLRRRMERVWRRTRYRHDRVQCNLCNRIMEKAKANSYANIILDNSEDPKKLRKSINNILHRFPAPSLPENLSLKTICEKLSNFFVDKISIIRSKFPDDNELRNVHPSYDIIFLMNTLTLATEAEIKKLIMKSKSTSSDLDPFPTSLLKDCPDVLIEPITSIINKSLQEGVFPDQFKKAYIGPLLKKTLDKNELKNYRPVSNLSFISKIFEKVVASRLLSHMESNSMSNNLQSAYKKFHSTESALLKGENDVLLNMEKGRVTALTLLDLSAAFDTIDHFTLISRLSSWYGISGTALDWFTSYLSNQCQQVKIHDYISEAVYISFGVPQGSVLGPILFTLYTAPLSHVIAEHDVEHHLYADDTHIYISLSGSEASESLTDLKSCVTDVFTWMTNSKLKLNPSKTEIISIGSKKQGEWFKDLFPI